ncbi:hypothetical protein H2O64_15000 [Kordia sp. YSTF-M3]|uniref:Chromosome partition protein Smc n=1 Tax=Kordia aestuariivivens TaxID=2759037 RepID=A0ABR7QBN0_9FLAO|nr:hypothetical protein [Kordia aestuariivivens]MBC8755984.1 hypothetical protein [Kordia aestuariivivens]
MKNIENEIKDILESNYTPQKKAIQLQKGIRLLFDCFENKEIKDEFNSFSEKLIQEITSLKQRTEEVHNCIKRNENLLEEKESTESKFVVLEEKYEELNILKKKQAFLNQHNLQSINSECINISKDIHKTKEQYINTLEELNKFLLDEKEEQSECLKENINKTIKNIELLASQQNDQLEELSSIFLNTKYDQFKNEVETLTADYNQRVEKINSIKLDLNEIKEKHAEIMQVFNLHHLENNAIYGVLSSREGVLEYVKKIRDDIEHKLNAYDKEIKSIMENREQLPLFELAEIKTYN